MEKNNNSGEGERLQSRLKLLKLKLEEGKIAFSSNIEAEIRELFSAVRVNENGDIDLSTVGSEIRTMALAAEAMDRRDVAKRRASLQDISSNYFDFLECNFGSIRDDVAESGLNIQQAAFAISRNGEYASLLSKAVPDILDSLDQFWESASETSEVHIQDIQGTKAVFGGDLFPSYTASIASSLGLYVETIVLPDPFHRSKTIIRHTTEERKAFFLVKHALNSMRYRDLALANVENPIIVINPFRSSVQEDEVDFLRRASERDAIKHAECIFGRSFDCLDGLLDFVKPLDTAEKLVEKVMSADHVLFDVEWRGGIDEQLSRVISGDWGAMGGEHHAGRIVVYQLCLGRMRQATDVLLNSRYLCGVPLIDAPTSWQYFNWKLEYNAERGSNGNKDLHMIKGLQRAAQTDETWLGKIPHEALIEMRKEGAFGEIRDVLSAGVEGIAVAKPESFFRSSDQIVDNIRTAFDRHSTEVAALKEKSVKFAGHDIGSMLVAGGLDLASIATGYGTWGAASWAVNQFLDVPKIRDIPGKFRSLKNAHIELRKSPMGLFFKHM